MTKQDTDRDFYFPPRSSICTQAFHTFCHDFEQQFRLFMLTVNAVYRLDESAVRAAKALIQGSADEERRKSYQATIDNPNRMSKELQKYSYMQSRNLLSNSIDAFLWYFSAIIQAAIKKRPELIKSNETLRVEEILEFKTRSDLVAYMIDRKINELSYGGLKEMEKYISDRLGLPAFQDSNQRNLLSVFIELRNIYVHNRGIVNRLFLSRVPKVSDFKFQEGKRFHLDYDGHALLSEVAIKSALALDDLVASKFKLQRKKLSTWLKDK